MKRHRTPLHFKAACMLSSCGGFSLVEVALAIGLLAFALLPIMGLLPVAMNVSRDAIDRASEVRMLQSIRADVLASDSDAMLQAKVHFFDMQGNSLVDLPDESDAGASYYEVTRGTPTSTALPGGQSSAHLRTIHITLLRHPQNWTSQKTLHVPANGN